jgi:hypothetical protein
MSTDKTDSHKSRCYALSNDTAIVCQHTQLRVEAESDYLHNWFRRHKIEII